MDASVGFKISFTKPNANFGYSVSSAGDINGDGVVDIIVGCPNENTATGNNEGAGFVFFGKTSLIYADLTAGDNMGSSVGFKISGRSGTSGYLGTTVTGLKDFNQDNINDVAIAAINEVGDRGAVYIIYGKSTNTWADLRVSLSMANGFRIFNNDGQDLGRYIGSAGDSNKDGYEDIAIGIKNYKGENGGAFFVLFSKSSNIDITLGANMNSTNSGFLVTPRWEDRRTNFGLTIRPAGDLNKDGIPDLLVAAYAAYDGGAVYIIFGKSKPRDVQCTDSSPGSDCIMIKGWSSGQRFGFGMEVMDMDSDGWSEFIILGTTINKIYVFTPFNCSIPNQYIDLTDLSCQSCDFANFTFIDTACQLSCPSHCSICPNTTYCDACEAANYTLTGGQCHLNCPSHCSNCNDATHCNTCESANYTVVGGFCELNCADGCSNCANSTYCNTCESANYTLTNGLCELNCPSHCTNCIDATHCNTCESANYTVIGGFCKLNCASHCSNCIDATHCNTCNQTNYTVVGGFCGLNCPSHCSNCDDATHCNTCESANYTINGGFCELNCPSHCSNCVDSTYCNTCDQANYTVVGGLCQLNCPYGCSNCLNSTYCNTCELANHTAIAGVCQASCPLNCASCSSTTQCLECQSANYTISSGSCVLSCPKHCSSCLDSTQCLICDEDYTLDSNGACLFLVSEIVKSVAAAIQTQTTIAASVVTATTLVGTPNSDTVKYQSLHKMLVYLRYIDIKYTAGLRYVFSTADTDQTPDTPIIQMVDQNINYYFNQHPVPDIFGHLKSSFIINYWKNLSYILVILLAISFFTLIDRATQDYTKINGILQKIITPLKWNFFIVNFASQFSDIALFTIIELRTALSKNLRSLLVFTFLWH